MTTLERAILSAIDERVAQHDSDTEVQMAALRSALDDLMTHQASLQQDLHRMRLWLEHIVELTPEKDLESAQALARVALRTGHWPPGNRR